jgi:hypothetical protein
VPPVFSEVKLKLVEVLVEVEKIIEPTRLFDCPTQWIIPTWQILDGRVNL